MMPLLLLLTNVIDSSPILFDLVQYLLSGSLVFIDMLKMLFYVPCHGEKSICCFWANFILRLLRLGHQGEGVGVISIVVVETEWSGRPFFFLVVRRIVVQFFIILVYWKCTGVFFVPNSIQLFLNKNLWLVFCSLSNARSKYSGAAFLPCWKWFGASFPFKLPL